MWQFVAKRGIGGVFLGQVARRGKLATQLGRLQSQTPRLRDTHYLETLRPLSSTLAALGILQPRALNKVYPLILLSNYLPLLLLHCLPLLLSLLLSLVTLITSDTFLLYFHQLLPLPPLLSLFTSVTSFVTLLLTPVTYSCYFHWLLPSLPLLLSLVTTLITSDTFLLLYFHQLLPLPPLLSLFTLVHQLLCSVTFIGYSHYLCYFHYTPVTFISYSRYFHYFCYSKLLLPLPWLPALLSPLLLLLHANTHTGWM